MPPPCSSKCTTPYGLSVLLGCLHWRGKEPSPLSLTTHASEHRGFTRCLFHQLFSSTPYRLQAIFKILTTKIKVSESFGFSVYKPEKLTTLTHHSSKVAFKAKHCHSEERAQTLKLTLSDAKACFFSVFYVYLFIFSKRYVY